MRDMFLAMRADEACHRSVNHHFSDIPQDYHVPAESIFVQEEDEVPDQEFKKMALNVEETDPIKKLEANTDPRLLPKGVGEKPVKFNFNQ